MARIRSIKPEMPQDAKLASVSRDTRYHFVLLWTLADDAGYFRAHPRSILGQLYPHDNEVSASDVERMNDALESIGMVEFRATPDGLLGRVCNWKKHQKIDRPSKSHLAEIFASFASVSRVSRECAAHGVLSPESLVLSPDLVLVVDSATNPNEQAEPTDEPDTDPATTALNLSIWANRAVTERWGEQPAPYTEAQCSGLARHLAELRVPSRVARESIYRQCRESKAAVPPRGPSYFRPGIDTHAEQEAARQALASSGETPPPESVRPPPGAASARPSIGARAFATALAAIEDL